MHIVLISDELITVEFTLFFFLQQLERENSGSQLKSQLDEMTSQLEKEREKNARMQEKLTQLEGYVSEVKLKRTQSKICIIM